MEAFHPDMCGIGPFIPHKDYAVSEYACGNNAAHLLSVIDHPADTAEHPSAGYDRPRGTIDPKGREKGILSGANVVMPNLSPVSVRKKYELYDDKICTGEEAAQCKNCLSRFV